MISLGYCQCGCGQKTRIASRSNVSKEWIEGEPLRFVHGHNRRRPLANRFWEKVDRRDLDDCWGWTGFRNKSGYGQIGIGGKLQKSHRIAWELVNGAIPNGLLVLHKCDRPQCCNPAHLFLGTHQDNANDRSCKGRGAYGEKIGNSKLTDGDIRRIRGLYASGIICKDIAREYGVGKTTIWSVVSRESWTHVHDRGRV